MIIVDWDLIKENNSSKTIFFFGENKFDSVNNGLKCGYFFTKASLRLRTGPFVPRVPKTTSDNEQS